MQTISRIDKLHSSVLGMDRLIRTYSFILRFAKTRLTQQLALLQKTPQAQRLMERSKTLDSVMMNLGSTRRVRELIYFCKILRWSRTAYFLLNLLNLAKNARKEGMEKVKRRLDLGFYCYLVVSDVIDFVGWVCTVGLCQNEFLKQQTREIVMKMYFYECVTWGVSIVLELVIIYQKLSSDMGEEQKQRLRARRKYQVQSLVKYCLDIPVAYSNLKPQVLKQQTIAGMGVVASSISLYQAYHS